MEAIVPLPADHEPITSLADARNRLGAALNVLATIVAWTTDQLGDHLLTYGLRRLLRDVAGAFDQTLEHIRDERPELGGADEAADEDATGGLP